MADIETFRAETRKWLEANCPASMRTPMVEEEVVWGGRGQKFVNPDSKVWLERMAARHMRRTSRAAQMCGSRCLHKIRLMRTLS